jgi:pimeloyl-ACP methyl ester carboxylesterase
MENMIANLEKVRTHFISAQDGLGLYVRDFGGPNDAGTTVVCLPGLTRNSGDFAMLAQHLAGKRRVICLDYRGRGRSGYDTNWRNYQPGTYVADLRHVLTALNIHRVAVIGTSLGGILAMAMTAAMPTVLAGAILNDIGPTIEAAGIARIRAYVSAMKNLGPTATLEQAAAMLRKNLPDWPAETEAEWLEVARNTYRKMDDGRLLPNWDPAIMRPIEEGSDPTPDLWPLFRGLRRVPVLAVRGETSDILSPETLQTMKETISHMATLTVPGVGHAPALNTMQERAAIDRCLSDIDAA